MNILKEGTASVFTLYNMEGRSVCPSFYFRIEAFSIMHRYVVQDVVYIFAISMKNNEKAKKMKKVLDKEKKRWYNVKAHPERGRAGYGFRA